VAQDQPEMVPTGLRLPREMYERLKQSYLGVSGEIRRRLERTFLEERYDVETRELADDVMWLAGEVQRQCGGLSWHLYPKAHEALAEALRMWLEISKRRAAESAAALAESAAALDLFGPDDPPTLGRSIARSYQREREDLHAQATAPVNLAKEVMGRIRKGQEGEKS
jgi:hypothetical protein